MSVCLCSSDDNIPLALLLVSFSSAWVLCLSHVTFLSVALWPSRVQCGAAATALTVLETATIQHSQTHDFVFAAQSGVRYDVDVRVGEGSGFSPPCTGNSYDACNHCRLGHKSCDVLVSSGHSCARDFCATCGQYAHYCDRTCGFLCTEDGVTWPVLHVLPPGATDNSQAVASQALSSADRDLGFTAAATGDFTARVRAQDGSGPVTLTATAVGTAEHRSPPLRADGRPHPLGISCKFIVCAFTYDDTPAYDGDGSGFDLVRDLFLH
eukprot:COSAG06_NODE_9145_length_1973_cov_3.001600_2_plen_267_part_00